MTGLKEYFSKFTSNNSNIDKISSAGDEIIYTAMI
jgi:hypothetical protein